jgi:hypothetical protein
MNATAFFILIFYAAFPGLYLFRGFRSGWTSGVQRGLAWSLVPAVVVLVFAVGLNLSSPGPVLPDVGKSAAQPGIEQNATRLRLREYASLLVEADKKGDVKLAKNVMLLSLGARVEIDHQPDAFKLGSGAHNCALAARNLVQAAEYVASGGRWINQDQFDNAVSDCTK